MIVGLLQQGWSQDPRRSESIPPLQGHYDYFQAQAALKRLKRKIHRTQSYWAKGCPRIIRQSPAPRISIPVAASGQVGSCRVGRSAQANHRLYDRWQPSGGIYLHAMVKGGSLVVAPGIQQLHRAATLAIMYSKYTRVHGQHSGPVVYSHRVDKVKPVGSFQFINPHYVQGNPIRWPLYLCVHDRIELRFDPVGISYRIAVGEPNGTAVLSRLRIHGVGLTSQCIHRATQLLPPDWSHLTELG